MSDGEPTDLPGAERRAHFRGRARAGHRVELRYRRADGQPTAAGSAEVKAVTRNIGVGGAFVLTEIAEPPGSELELAVIFPGTRAAVYLRADVRWVTDGGEDAHGAGMGVRFASLEAPALRAMADFFASLSGQASG